jgi:hypothetical protein
MDSAVYTLDDLLGLYARRWPVEEDYKVMKLRLEMENFSGKSVLSVYQDFFAKLFTKNLAAILTQPFNDTPGDPSGGRKHARRVNFTQALSKLKDTLVLLLTRPARTALRVLQALRHVLARTLEPVRPGRNCPRKHKMLRTPFYTCYKPAR